MIALEKQLKRKDDALETYKVKFKKMETSHKRAITKLTKPSKECKACAWREFQEVKASSKAQSPARQATMKRKRGLSLMSGPSSESDDLQQEPTKNSKDFLESSPNTIRKKPALREGFAIEAKDSEELSLFEIYTKNSTILNYDKD